MENLNEIFSGATVVPAGEALEVEIALADRVGLDGVSVVAAEIDPGGNLEMRLSDGTSLNAGRALGNSGLTGIAVFDTVPSPLPDPQIYVACGAGTYAHFPDAQGQPIVVANDNTIALFFCAGGGTTWEATEMNIDMTGYRPKDTPTYLSTEPPVFSFYPPSADAVPGCYDEATGKFTLPEGQHTITSQTEIFGKIVYKDCTHIMLGFNLEYTIYLEVATGRCMAMNTVTKELVYDSTPIASVGVSKKYVRVNTYNNASMIIDVEQSDDGIDYVPYATVNRGTRPGLFITYRTIGFYQTGDTDSKIISIGASDRFMLDKVVLSEGDTPDDLEVLVPSDNFAGLMRKKIELRKKPFADKRIVLYGDSITDEYGASAGSYTDKIKAKFSTQSVKKFGYVARALGSNVQDRSDALTDDVNIGALVAADPEVLIILAGTNDYWSNMPIGDYYGSVENAAYVRTTSGGLRYLLHHLIKNLSSDCRILFCTPVPGYYNGHNDMAPNTQGVCMDEYVKRIKDICAEYHVPVCDVWGAIGWSPDNEGRQKKYTTDGIHLSDAGYERLTTFQYADAERYLL